MKHYMKLALELAAKWKGFTSPNPVVGAVVVKNDTIVGQGAHKKAGGPHAEVFALEEAGQASEGSTLYVTLEPCSHHGKTPPCTDKIIESGVAKVVAAMEDPNPLVAGRGLKKLEEAGIEVEVGLCEEEARKLNEIFIKYILTRKPYVILKTAISLDGKIAASSGDSKWITNELSRIRVHQIRNQVDGIVVGKNTLLQDDPRLNVRLEGKSSDPQKIVLMGELDLTIDELEGKQVFKLSSQENPLILVVFEDGITNSQIDKLKELGVEVILLPKKDGQLDLDQLLMELAGRGITSILLEGGNGLYTGFLKEELVDKIYLFQAPKIVGDEGLNWVGSMGNGAISESLQLKDVDYEPIADNILTIGYL